MKRKQLLESALSTGENVKSVVEITTTKDNKFLKRTKQSLENEIEDLKEQLEARLSSEAVLDKSVIEVTFLNLKNSENLLELYKSFEKEYISENC